MKSVIPMISLLAATSLSAVETSPCIQLTVSPKLQHSQLMGVVKACGAANFKKVAVSKATNEATASTDITLTVPENIPHASVIKVLDACKTAGLSRVALDVTSAQ